MSKGRAKLESGVLEYILALLGFRFEGPDLIVGPRAPSLIFASAKVAD